MSLWLTVKYRFTLRSGQPDAPLFTTLVPGNGGRGGRYSAAGSAYSVL